MSKQPNKALIGAFVVGAIALAVIGVLVFGSGKLLSTRQKYVMFFDSSVKGLRVGAPVDFRGAKIGEVTDIVLRFDPEKLSVLISTYIEIDPAKFRPMGGATRELKSESKYATALIDKGLKARLDLQSFVTGLVAVSVDFFPGEPVRLTGIEKGYTEIPTIPSSTEKLEREIENLPLKSIADRLDNLLEALTTIMRSPELTGSLAALHQALTHMDALARDLDSHVGPLATGLASTSAAARGAFAQAERTLALKEGVPGELASSAKDALAAARSTLLEAQEALEGVKRATADDSSLAYELHRTLDSMTTLSRSLRSLADSLDRNPDAVIKGRRSSKAK